MQTAGPVNRSGGRALVLSGSIGRGHDVVAQVCEEALSAADLNVAVYDCMSLLGGLNARVSHAVFRALLSCGALYDAFHFSQLRSGGALSRRGNRAATRRIIERLDQVAAGVIREPGGGAGHAADPVAETDQVRLVLSVFATGAAAGAQLARRCPAARSVVFCTDATAHAMWVHPDTDLFLVTSELAAHTVLRYQSTAAVAIVPPPVRAPFYQARCQADARARIGLADGRPYALVMAGGWGLAPLAETAARLADAGIGVLAVAGTNRRLRARLAGVAASRPAVRAFGDVGRMHELMAAADVVVTSPGQACHEARVIGRPLVLLDAVPGHGRENLLHELVLGGARASSPRPESVLEAVRSVLTAAPQPRPWPVRSAQDWQCAFLAAIQPLGLGLAADVPRSDRAQQPGSGHASRSGTGGRVPASGSR